MNLQEKLKYEFQNQMDKFHDDKIGLAVSWEIYCDVGFSLRVGDIKQKRFMLLQRTTI